MMLCFNPFKKISIFLSVVLSSMIVANSSLACTRVLRVDSKAVMVGRNMDWMTMDMNTNLWVFPQGMSREGLVTGNSLKWTSKYGSMVATTYEIITSDGINDHGLAAHILWLDESNYGKRDENIAGISILLWAQFYLDNFQSVDEAVRYTETANFQIQAFYHPGVHKWVNVHLAIEDAKGDSAIIEYIDGKPRVYHNRDYTVLTNSPTYDLQLKNIPNMKSLMRDAPLPGTTNSVDRFVRAAFYVKRLPQAQSIRDEIAGIQSVLQNVAEPYGVPTPERKKIGPTIWHVIADLTHRVYYFNASNSLNMIWAQLDSFNLQPGSPVMKLDLVHNPDLTGDVTKEFKPEAV